jgi:oligopeptide/dipeptide ABC transporter ATP-binding protein
LSLLEVDCLRTTFPVEGKRIAVVDDVSFALRAGEVLALVGESGCGKSMTALSIMRLVPKPGRIDAGRIRLGDTDVLQLSVPAMRSVRGHRISMIFQEPMTSLNPVVKCGHQVVEAIQLHERASFTAARKRTEQLFHQVGIPDAKQRFDAFPHQLSGGLKQRVMIAMALSMRPQILIADEPTTALDVTIQAQILRLMRELQTEMDTAILLITHDLGVVNEMADRVAVMYAGRIVEVGRRERVLGHPAHPYTKGLLAAIPARATRGAPLYEIHGVVPPPAQWSTGCRFCSRCPEVMDQCADQLPPQVMLDDDHRAFCHALQDPGRGEER